MKEFMKNKKGEWLLVHGKNFMSLQPQYYCNVCKNTISTYYPPKECEHCGSFNAYNGNSISLSAEMIWKDD